MKRGSSSHDSWYASCGWSGAGGKLTIRGSNVHLSAQRRCGCRSGCIPAMAEYPRTRAPMACATAGSMLSSASEQRRHDEHDDEDQYG
jgi:hypothetical protein